MYNLRLSTEIAVSLKR